jgi:RNA chaperone Hfq
MDVASVGSNERAPQVQRHNAEMIRFRDERRTLVFTLTNGTTLEGAVRWFDDEAVCVVDGNRDETTVFKHAIVHYRPKPSA